MSYARSFVGFGTIQQGKALLDRKGYVPYCLASLRVKNPAGMAGHVPAIYGPRKEQEQEDSQTSWGFLLFGDQFGGEGSRGGGEFILLADLDPYGKDWDGNIPELVGAQVIKVAWDDKGKVVGETVLPSPTGGKNPSREESRATAHEIFGE